MTLRVGIPDLISPSYFPVIAAVELGHFERTGIPASIELVYPVTEAVARLRAGELDYLGGAAHAPLHVYGGWDGWVLLAAQSLHMYWFLVARRDLGIGHGNLDAVRGLRIGAAPGPVDGLRCLLASAGVDPDAEVRIRPVAGTGADVSFGVTAARALERGDVDAFWANGMAKEIAVREGFGTVVVDARRDPGPGRDYTFAALIATEDRLRERPCEAAAATRALRAAQHELRGNPAAASQAAARLFPPSELGLIADLVATDAPYYDPSIPPDKRDGLRRFGVALGLAQTGTSGPRVALEAEREWS